MGRSCGELSWFQVQKFLLVGRAASLWKMINLIVKQPELLGDEVEGKLVSFSRWAQDSKVDLMRTCLV